ncbi:MAG: hypothetical protein ACE5I1_27065 [bacterium]
MSPRSGDIELNLIAPPSVIAVFGAAFNPGILANLLALRWRTATTKAP